MVKIKEIKGVLLEKREIPLHEDYAEAIAIGFNQCRQEQGQVSIGLNRDKLINKIEDFWREEDFLSELPSQFQLQFQRYIEKLADEIIAKEHEILEVKDV